jgi:MSHA biogenesis protein MshI
MRLSTVVFPMSLFRKAQKKNGWLAVCLNGGGVSAVHVERPSASRPLVQCATSFPAEQGGEADAFARLCKELHAERYRCTTLLGAGEYQLLTVEAPNVPPDELKTAMRWRMKDLLDYHVDDATIDVLDIPVDRNAPSRNHSMYVVAARNQTIQQRQQLFSDAQIPVSVIDIPEMAQRNITALFDEPGRGIACLSFDSAGGLLTVTYAGELYLSRRIDLPVGQLSGATEEQLATRFDRITLELQRSLDHFERQYQFITISKVLLAPMGEGGERLKQYLGSNLYLPVEMIDLESALDLSAVPELRDKAVQQRYLMTLGCALRNEEKVL